ncbi:MAG: M15 family metallopeptidase [Cellvibrio sp.]|nr:M15 family metallopeptidase [Cellvibrio sp.]
MNKERLLGLDDNSVVYDDHFKQFLHPDVIVPLQELSRVAAEAGFLLALASGYRNFSRQLLIWNQKVSGARAVYDSEGNIVNMTILSDDEKLWAILRWSALPGASRHHWGTDVDIYDRSKIDANYQLQLTVAETVEPRPFAEFHLWLTEKLAEKNCPFYRPYAVDKGGVAPEPWHLSYTPVANQMSAQFSLDLLVEQIQQTDILLKESILRNIEEIYQRFIKID